MSTIEATAFARAGLLGNPSDGYHGKTISFTFADFGATVRISPSPQILVVPGPEDGIEFACLDDFVRHTDRCGYHGGLRLIKAAIMQFARFGKSQNWRLDRPFRLTYRSNIPRQVGLAGSSAIVVATLQALCRWHDVQIPPHLMATLAWRAEHEIGITAGLQDRVIQSYRGLVYMDFGKDVMRQEDGIEVGQYQRLSTDRLSNLYIAYAAELAQPTEVLHDQLKTKYQSGDDKVIDTLQEIASLAEIGKQAIETGDSTQLDRLINRNFDLRRSICQLHPEHVRLVTTARACGASAKYCGSGGAIVGRYQSEAMWEALVTAFTETGCHVLRPQCTSAGISFPD